MKHLRSILVPLDGSPPSIAALEHAIEIARDSSTEVRVLRVLSTSDTLSPGAREDADQATAAALEGAQLALRNRLSEQTVVGEPTREILAAARSTDLIVMGTHGRIGRLHALLGSVAEAVVRNAPCPVLTVREPGDDYQSFADSRHHRPSIGREGTEPTARRHR